RSDGLAHAGIVAGDYGAFKHLEALFIAFLDLDVHLDGVAGPELRVGRPQVLLFDLGHHCVLHNLVSTFSNLLINRAAGAEFSPAPHFYATCEPLHGCRRSALPALSSRETPRAAYSAANPATLPRRTTHPRWRFHSPALQPASGLQHPPLPPPPARRRSAHNRRSKALRPPDAPRRARQLPR